jgi:uncharacterized protein YndB with AHSA1/START domain
MSSSEPVGASLVADGADWVLIVERTLAHPSAPVWAALTEVDQLASWGPFRPDRGLTSPGTVQLTMLGVDPPLVLEGRVLEVAAPSLLVLEWGADVLRWELTEEDGASHLVLRHRFSDRDEAASYAAGWDLCITALGALLAGAAMSSVAGDAALAHGWHDLKEHYEGILLPTSPQS